MRPFLSVMLVLAFAGTVWSAVAQAGPTPAPTATPMAASTESIVGWGENLESQETSPDAVDGISKTATDISVGDYHALAMIGAPQSTATPTATPTSTPTPTATSTPTPISAPLTKDQQACVNEMNKNGEKVNKAQLKEIERCLMDFQSEKLVAPMTFDECMTADRKGKLQKAKIKTVTQEGRKCDPLAVPAPFAFADSATLNTAAVDGALALTYEIFGSPPVRDADLVTKPDDKEAAKCQIEVLKRAGRLENTIVKELIKTNKLALKDDAIDSGAALEARLRAVFSSNFKIEVARGMLVTGIDRKCAALQAPPEAIFAGNCREGNPDLRGFEFCAIVATHCAACLKINAFDDLNLDCDQVDDQTANGSCP